ncbi:hypothetical protein GJR96_01320 [Haloferax sp. MBLA0076]|uniref:Uncharacterized protein n=1 Tax=Haloferax litoreum TaxID=2666140 RepID=A0A6A8GCI6_9EURY|nr:MULTISPECIES: hypothetical protein [Haloferax]MRX20601.1 hypothetical protein [Haloferax litoreum]
MIRTTSPGLTTAVLSSGDRAGRFTPDATPRLYEHESHMTGDDGRTNWNETEVA